MRTLRQFVTQVWHRNVRPILLKQAVNFGIAVVCRTYRTRGAPSFCSAAISPSEYEPWGIVTTGYPYATRALSDRSPPPRLSAAPLSRLSKLAPLRNPNAATPHLLILKMAGL